MAARKNREAEAAQEENAAEAGAETTAEPETPQSGNETAGEAAAEVKTLVYIGPNIAYSKLRSSMILKGTAEEIEGFLHGLIETYPEIPRLLVPPAQLADALQKVASKGTILHKYYEDMLAKSRASRTNGG